MVEVALITGCTSGIGKAFAYKIASEGYDIVLVSRNSDKLINLANQISQTYGVKAYTIVCDLAKHNAANEVFKRLQELQLTITILVNNAGFNECGCFIKTDYEKELSMIYLHIIFITQMMKLILPSMIQNHYGRILNVGSTGSYISCPYDAVYAATKQYILSISKGIGGELNGTGVSVTVLCPGSTNTEFAQKAGMENTLLFKLFVMKPDMVVNIGYRAMMKRKASVIAGLYNKLIVFSSYLLPNCLVNLLSRKMLNNQ